MPRNQPQNNFNRETERKRGIAEANNQRLRNYKVER